MALWNFISEKLLPLFGTIPTDKLNFGWLGEWSALEIVQTAFWIVLGGCIVHFLVYLPYRGILALMRYRKWKKGSGKS